MVLIMNFLEQNGNPFYYMNSLGRKAQGQSGTQLFLMDRSEWYCILVFENGNGESLLQSGVLTALRVSVATLFSPNQTSLMFLMCLVFQ